MRGCRDLGQGLGRSLTSYIRYTVLGEPQPGFIARDGARGHGPEGKWTYGRSRRRRGM